LRVRLLGIVNKTTLFKKKCGKNRPLNIEYVRVVNLEVCFGPTFY
jgi:hypothetical protein